jgi:Ca2+-binding RTX toxin-like protein
MINTGLRVLGLSLVALAVLFVSAAPARAANVSCQIASGGVAGIEGNVLKVSDTSESVTHIYRDGDEIVIFNNADSDPAVCARGIPTVFNIDRIEYRTSSGVPFINYLGNGPLEPGATDEPGGDEIEITVIEDYEPKVVNVGGGPEADRIEIGQRNHRRVGINLNAQADGDSQDVDLSAPIAKGEQVYLRVVAKGGDDELSALGAPGYPEPVLAAERLVMTGGPGNDILNGGPSRDALSGNDGNDQLFGGRGRDKLLVGPGRDLANGGKGGDDIENQSDVGGIAPDLFPDQIFGGAGNDSISVGQQLRGDRVDCGAGRRDDVFKDAGDISLRCERTDFR